MTNSGKVFADDFTGWLTNEAGFKQSQYQISIYYKYAQYGAKNRFQTYVDNCVYWYTSEAHVK